MDSSRKDRRYSVSGSQTIRKTAARSDGQGRLAMAVGVVCW